MRKVMMSIGMLAMSVGLMLNTSCKKKDDGDKTETTSKYVLITMSENTLTKPGFATAFDALPSGNISNNAAGALQGLGFGGWRPYNDWLMKMFNTEQNALGIEKLNVNANGSITPGAFIASTSSTNGSGNFVIMNDQKGFYWDGTDPLKIQTFNPKDMQRTGEFDYASVVNQRGESDTAIKFRSIGQKFLAVKNGKLFANITYAKTNGTQKGFFDDYYPDVYIAVIDATTGAYEKTIKIENTGSIAYINDNNMYDFDSNGDLYIVTQGRTAIGGQSKIVRIKANETDIDLTWSLEMDAITPGGKFVSVFAKDGKIITVIPNVALTGGPTGNINFEDIWEFYSIDIATKSLTKITGVPAVTNPGAAFCAVEIDNKILIRVNTKDGTKNGYYELNGHNASPLFNVSAGGSVQGIHKVQVNK